VGKGETGGLPPSHFPLTCFEVGCRGMFPIIELMAVRSDIVPKPYNSHRSLM